MSGQALKSWNTEDFENLSWHDCKIWGWELVVDYPDEGKWLHDLVFHIEFITQWVCEKGGVCEFVTAPARLVFHDVTGIRMNLVWDKGGDLAPNPIDIYSITRGAAVKERYEGVEPRYPWEISCRDLVEGQISFTATGFTQTLLAEPTVAE